MTIDIRRLLTGTHPVPFVDAIPAIDLPSDGNRFLRIFAEHFGSKRAIILPQQSFQDRLMIGDHRYATSSWYSTRQIAALVCEGDLIIDGDLIDDDHSSSLPALIISGNLHVRNWLRGGMHSWIGGNVRATGLIIGKYNDAALYVGGDLEADGYIRCTNFRMPEPGMEPHQIAGRLNARSLDLMDDTLDLKEVLVDDVLRTEVDADGSFTYFDEDAALKMGAEGRSIWR